MPGRSKTDFATGLAAAAGLDAAREWHMILDGSPQLGLGRVMMRNMLC